MPHQAMERWARGCDGQESSPGDGEAGGASGRTWWEPSAILGGGGQPAYLLSLHVPRGHEEGHVPVWEVAGQLVCPHQGPARQETPLQVAPADTGQTELGPGGGRVAAHGPREGPEAGHTSQGSGAPLPELGFPQDPVVGTEHSAEVPCSLGKPTVFTALQTPQAFGFPPSPPERKGRKGDIWGFFVEPLRAKPRKGRRGRGGLLHGKQTWGGRAPLSGAPAFASLPSTGSS